MRILLLMASRTYKASAFLAAASQLDCAIVVGTDHLQVLAHLDPPGNLLLPFHDLQRGIRRIEEHHARFPLDAILAADDEGVALAAAASAALGLRGNTLAAVTSATDKQQTRRAFAAAGLPTPQFREVHNIKEAEKATAEFGFPCVVKPLRMSASRGVIRVDNPQQLRTACARLQKILSREPASATHTSSWLVEQYIPGREFALEGLLIDGVLHTLAIFDKPDPLEGPYFQETLYITPSRQSPGTLQRIEHAVARSTAALQLQQGPIHAEIRCDSEALVVLEVAPRSIGGRCSTALRFDDTAKTSLEEVLLRSALRLQSTPPARESAASGVMMIPIPNAGILRAVQGLDQAQGIRGITAAEWTIPIGQKILPPPEGGRYLGFLFAKADRPLQVEQVLREAHDCLRIDIETIEPNPAGAASPLPTKEQT